MVTHSGKISDWAARCGVDPRAALEFFLERASIIAEATGQSAQDSEIAAIQDMENSPESYLGNRKGVSK